MLPAAPPRHARARALTCCSCPLVLARRLRCIPRPQVFDNVLVQPRDAREASDVFYRQRLGDVLLTYENEVVLTNQVGGCGGMHWPALASAGQCWQCWQC